MGDEPISGAAPAVASVTTPAPAATITSPEPLAGDGNTEPISLEEAKKLRSEAQALRKREKDVLAQLKTYQDAEQAAKDAQLSEIEKVTKQHAELQAQYEDLQAEILESRVFQAVALNASKHNFVISPDMIMRLLDWSEIEFDEESDPTNIEKLLEKLAKDAPDLVKQQVGTPTQSGVPSLPAMNPGRSSITQPGQQQPGKIPRLTDPGLWRH